MTFNYRWYRYRSRARFVVLTEADLGSGSRWLTVAEAARRLGVSTQTVLVRAYRGEYRLGRRAGRKRPFFVEILEKN